MSPVFLDTVGILGLFDDTDQWHNPAQTAWGGVLGQGRRYFTTPQVLMECGNAFARTPFRDSICDLRDELTVYGNLVAPMPKEVELAWTTYRAASAGGPSIVDCISFEVMRRIGATEAFTNDRHFAAAGFTVLF